MVDLARLPYADLGVARVDHHRPLRQGMPEAVYGPGKTPGQCEAVVAELLGHGDGPVVLTRSDEAQRAAVLSIHPGALVEECVAVLAAFGIGAKLLADCGVAGVHRLLDQVDTLTAADAVVVVAGMEGALPSVVAGLVAAPVVAVPTSVGYGSSLGGVTALLAMTASCAPGVTVVGIDNGYGAACAAARALRQR